MSGPVVGQSEGLSLEIASLAAAYRDGLVSPTDVVNAVYDRIAARGSDAVWISLVPREVALLAAVDLGTAPDARPLWGIPFAVKDNFDTVGLDTTAACPAFSYSPAESATAVRLLLEAGALLVGKTNLDQFATGLNGTRSPYGIPQSPFDPTLISGGSSSGSAVAVSVGLVSFAMGTDTAGSGRVPAAFTSTVGIKPSRGLVSNFGMVPACQSLDCASVFALTVTDGATVLNVLSGVDARDPWSRELPAPTAAPVAADLAEMVLAVPVANDLGLDPHYQLVWDAAIGQLAVAGVQLVPIPFDEFFDAGSLLYEGPWLAERLSGLEDFFDEHPDDLHPVTREMLARGRGFTGADAFRGLSRLRALRGAATTRLSGFDALLTPTAPATFSIEDMLADPVVRNSALGRFTTFGNLLDMATVAVPAGFTAHGVPFGLSVSAFAGADARVAGIALAFEDLFALPLGATGAARRARTTPRSTSSTARPAAAAGAVPDDGLLLAVVGAHLSGMPLNAELVELGARLVEATRTSSEYRLYALPGGSVEKPGLVRSGNDGVSIELEIYCLPAVGVGSFLQRIASPLGIGTIRLEDGRSVHGFLCEQVAAAGAQDISGFGGWRRYVAESLVAP